MAPDNPKPISKTAAVDNEARKLQSPRLLDLGADKCVPCKMMAPILEELRREQKGRLRVEFVDVWKHPDAAKKYRVKSIPTQIFFDRDGREFYRHQGFIPKAEILKVFQDQRIQLGKGD